MRSFAVAMPEAPAPVKTTRMSLIRFLTSCSALISAAITTTAVPCWSSWNTGMSSSFRRRSSISKQRGAEMSSRLTPPKAGETALTIITISSGSLVARHSGNASTLASSLKRSALPSITGIAALGPMSPRPSTAVPSVTTATQFCLIVSVYAFSGSAWMAMHTRATPGVYAIERSSRVLRAILDLTSIFPPRCIRKVRSDTLTTVTPSTPRIFSTICSPCFSSLALKEMSRVTLDFPTSTRSIAPMSPPHWPIADVTFPSMPGWLTISRRTIRL